MKSSRFVLAVLFLALLGVLTFSGQRRPTRSAPPRPATTKPVPPKEPEPETTTPWIVLQPDDIPWPQGAPGATQNVTLYGNPRNNELYVTRTRIPKGNKVLPHFHPEVRTVVVVSGTYYYGVGERFDESKLLPFPPGSFLTEPAGLAHFAWAKDGDVIVQTTALGPSGTRVLPDPIQP